MSLQIGDDVWMYRSTGDFVIFQVSDGPIFQDGKYWYEGRDGSAKQRYGYLGSSKKIVIKESPIKGYMIFHGSEE